MTTVLPGERNKRLYKKVKAALPAEMHDSLDADLASVNSYYEGQTGALETVRYWLLDVLVHGRPMQKPPREVLRIVEEAL